LAVQGDRPDRSLDRVAVEFDAAVVQESGQSFPASERIADRLGKAALAADLHEPRVQNAMEFVDDGATMLLARCATMIGRLAANIGLESIESGDAREHVGCHRRCASSGKLVEAATEVRPTESERDLAPTRE